MRGRNSLKEVIGKKKTPTKKAPAKVVIEPTEEFPTSIIAGAIIDMARAMKILSNSPLRREAIVTLIKDKSGLDKNKIELVLNNLEALEENWIKKNVSSKARRS